MHSFSRASGVGKAAGWVIIELDSSVYSIQQDRIMARPRIALIIGSTRKTRFADKPAQWMLAQMQAQRRSGRRTGRSSRLRPAAVRRGGIEHVGAKRRSARRGLAEEAGRVRRLYVRRGRIQPLDHRGAEERAGPGLCRMGAQADGGHRLWLDGRGAGAGASAHHRGGVADGADAPCRAHRRRRFLQGAPAWGERADQRDRGEPCGSAKSTLDDIVWWANATMAAKARG